MEDRDAGMAFRLDDDADVFLPDCVRLFLRDLPEEVVHPRRGYRTEMVTRGVYQNTPTLPGLVPLTLTLTVPSREGPQRVSKSWTDSRSRRT